MSAPVPAADRNLIFGLLALQMDFITREQLLDALHAWMLAKHNPLGQVLCRRGFLAEDARADLERLVDRYIKGHGSDPRASLAALRVEPLIRSQLLHLKDADVQHSIAALSPPPPDMASLATLAPIEAGTAPPSPAAPGVRFRRLREHARGGLGEVFVALDEELNREVALKEIQDYFADDPGSRARFLREAEVTGKLEHPGIVPVYGLGAYANGRPFYAMRFIRGQSMQEAISRFHKADEDPRRDPGERSLALRELLMRFVAVCNAVAYAHNRGVIHRDLKPANAMLGEYGETLVVDWGLAKPVDRPEDASTTGARSVLAIAAGGSGTQMGHVVGTPAFMPPEQVNGHLDQVGPRSDVFSLGATLYALLTGSAPYRGTDAVIQAALAQAVPARQRKTSVPAALEAICAKAMAAKPEDRYPSARALAEDVQRWLADEPVSAYPEPWSVRAGRWLRRHKTLAASTAAVLLATLVIGGFAAWRLEQHAARQRRGVEAALAEVARLQQQARWAEARVALDAAENRLKEGGTESLRRRVKQVRRDLDLVARLDAIRLKRATWMEGGFDYAGADRSYEETFREAGMGEVESDAAVAAAWVRKAAMSDVLIAALDDWTVCARKPGRRNWLLEVARQVDPDPWRDRARDPVLWNDWKALGRLIEEKAVVEQSPQLLGVLATRLIPTDAERLLRATQQRHPEDFQVNFDLGNALHKGKKAEEAVGYFRAALALRPRAFAVNINLGNALRETGNVDEAIICQRKAIEIDPGIALAYNNLGNSLGDTGKVDEAVACYRKAIALEPGLAVAHNNLGTALRELGKREEGIAELRKAIALNPKFAMAHTNLGNSLGDLGKLDEAIAELRKAISIDRGYAPAYESLGVVYLNQGRLNPARQATLRSLALLPSNDPRRKSVLHRLRQCERMLAADKNLPAVLAGKARPVDSAGWVTFAQLCMSRKHHAAASRFFVEAFAAQPTLADDLQAGHRYNAACAAVLTSARKDKGDPGLDDKQRAWLRRQALGWLRADLALWRKQAKTTEAQRWGAQKAVRHWQKDTDLTGVRDEAALEKLPEGERAEWKNLWADVAAMLKKGDESGKRR
jgi:tetratricopeptide (TPR) repeat protein